MPTEGIFQRLLVVSLDAQAAEEARAQLLEVTPVELERAIDRFVTRCRHIGLSPCAREDADVVSLCPPPFDDVVTRELVTAEVMWWIVRTHNEDARHGEDRNR